MKIEITRWQPVQHQGEAIAAFNFRVGDIITVRAALFLKRGDRYHVTMPFTQHRQKNGAGLTAVGMGGDLFHDVIAAAEAYYLGLSGDTADEPDDAGLRRVLCAGGEEALRAAGI